MPAVPVCVFAFDLLYRDGRSLVRLPLAERRRQLLQVRAGHAGRAMGVSYCTRGPR